MPSTPRSAVGALLAIGGSIAVALSMHTAVNERLMRRPSTHPPPVSERVAILLPARDEEHRIAGAVKSAVAQRGLQHLEVLVLDDGSGDATAEVALEAGGGDPRLRVVAGSTPPGQAPPAGWLGKPHACHQLATLADAPDVLVFLDADVLLQPHAVAAAVDLLRHHELDLVSPYPHQIAEGAGPRLVQPLLQWSWLTFLPLRWAERSHRPSLSAANGQLLVLDALAYRRAGGHVAVKGSVLEDVELLRAVKRSGGRGVVVDGTQLASCHMYEDLTALRAGYRKSLWAAFGSGGGAAGVAAVLALAYLVPPTGLAVSLARGWWPEAVMAATGTLAGLAGRVVVARAVEQPVWPDVLAHPISVTALLALTGDSWWARRRGELTWKGRPID